MEITEIDSDNCLYHVHGILRNIKMDYSHDAKKVKKPTFFVQKQHPERHSQGNSNCKPLIRSDHRNSRDGLCRYGQESCRNRQMAEIHRLLTTKFKNII